MIKTKPPTKRAKELAVAMLAGFEDDHHTFMRALVERRSASYADMLKAWTQGETARKKV